MIQEQNRTLSSYGKIQIEGDDVATVFAHLPTAFGEVVRDEEGGYEIGRITPTKYLIMTPSENEAHLLNQLTTAINDRFITVTSQSNGLVSFHFPHDATDVLSQLCGLDFSDGAFPVNSVKSSSFAKIRATIWRLSDGWHVWIGRSYAQYITDIIRAAEATR